jgi:uncharacterized membrane protein (UPF0127 family)
MTGWTAKGPLIGALFLGASMGAEAACLPQVLHFGAAAVKVELAVTPAERNLGLMHRKSLAPDRGMLFLYDAPGHPHFWMKDTLIALDMIFLSPEGKVLRIHEGAVPLDETPIDGGAGVLSVLEVAAGGVDRMGIALGAMARAEGPGCAID